MEVCAAKSIETVARGLLAQLTILDPAMDQLLTVETSLVFVYRKVVVVSVMSSTNQELSVTSGVGLMLSAEAMKMRLRRTS